MSIQTDQKVARLEKRMKVVEDLIAALREDLEAMGAGDPELEDAPGLKIPPFPKTLKELGFEPPEEVGEEVA